MIWGSFRDNQGSFRSHLGLMFGEIKNGGSGGRSPPVTQGGLGGRQAPQLWEVATQNQKLLPKWHGEHFVHNYITNLFGNRSLRCRNIATL